jgi:hypothetical protein
MLDRIHVDGGDAVRVETVRGIELSAIRQGDGVECEWNDEAKPDSRTPDRRDFE